MISSGKKLLERDNIFMAYKHLIDLNDFSISECDTIIALAEKILQNPQAYSKQLEGKILATLFYEPSTRTQMSFQAAMLRLGGQTIGFDNPMNSSVAKGENLCDTIQIISGYADMIVMRHPLEGSAKAAALCSPIPVINAGDGGHLHPTQTLTDLLTLHHEKGGLENLCVGLCGDLKNGRTVHSLVKYLCRYHSNHFVFISTPQLKMPAYVLDVLHASGCTYEEVFSLEEAMPKLDVLYMTRIQKERFSSEEEYREQCSHYILNKEKMQLAKSSLRVLHPLPRVDEISCEVDKDSRAVYFKNGFY